MSSRKSKIIDSIAKKMELSTKEAAVAVNCILDAITDELKESGRVEVRGFGSFSVHHHSPRKAHNPKTGDSVHIAAKRTPHFKPGVSLKKAINDSRAHTAIQEHVTDEDR